MISLRFGRAFLVFSAAVLALFAPPALVRFAGYLFLLLVALALVYSLLAARSVSVARDVSRSRSVRLTSFPLRLFVKNSLPFMLPRVVVTDAFGRLQVDRFHHVITLPAAGVSTIETTARGLLRGVYPLGPVHVQGVDPFGLFPWQKHFRLDGTVVIYPSILPIELVSDRGLPAGSLHASDPIYEDVTRFRSLRAYTIGDEPKRVNWKASAKTGRLLTTQYDRTLAFPVRVALNLMRDDYPERRRDAFIERAVETAASVIFEFIKAGMAVGLVVSGEGGARPSIIPERAGWAHADNLFENLAAAGASPGTADFYELAGGGGGAAGVSGFPSGLRIIYVSPQPTQEQVAQLRAVKGRGRNVELLKLLPDAEADPAIELAALLRVVRISEFGEKLRGG